MVSVENFQTASSLHTLSDTRNIICYKIVLHNIRVFICRQTNTIKGAQVLTITSMYTLLCVDVNNLPDSCLQLELSLLKRIFFKRNACKRDKKIRKTRKTKLVYCQWHVDQVKQDKMVQMKSFNYLQQTTFAIKHLRGRNTCSKDN